MPCPYPLGIDENNIDLDTILLQIKYAGTIHVFWRYQSGNHSELRTKDIKGKYVDQILEAVGTRFEIRKGEAGFKEILGMCGANCPLEYFPPLPPYQATTASLPDSSSSEDEGSPIAITRARR